MKYSGVKGNIYTVPHRSPYPGKCSLTVMLMSYWLRGSNTIEFWDEIVQLCSTAARPHVRWQLGISVHKWIIFRWGCVLLRRLEGSGRNRQVGRRKIYHGNIFFTHVQYRWRSMKEKWMRWWGKTGIYRRRGYLVSRPVDCSKTVDCDVKDQTLALEQYSEKSIYRFQTFRVYNSNERL